MGCAGSKPHHLSSSHVHTNSPQKGFILFNSKTIEYLKANENEIKAKLIERCEHKLLKMATVSGGTASGGGASKSLFGTSKKPFLLTSSASTNDAANKVASDGAEKKNGTSKTNFSLDKLNEANKFKEVAIESAVDYVLKYAINDFDIDNFKSSNHLSMKQIRKDIMKKNSASGMSLSKLHAHANGANVSTLSKTDAAPGTNGAANTSISTMTGTLKSSETSFYKLALNTTIDEFGLFIQENFVVINEFNAKQNSTGSLQTKNGGNSEEKAASVPSNGTKATPGGLNAEDEAALKLKEALELARQNFYKGKMSMVCLTKTGGYVVKEVKDNENNGGTGQEIVVTATSDESNREPATPVKSAMTTATGETESGISVAAHSSSPITPENLSNAKTVTILDPQTNQKSKVAISSKINIEDVDISATFKIIETNQNEQGVNDESLSTLNTSNNSHAELTTKKSSRTSLRLSKKEKSKSKVQASESSPSSKKTSVATSESMAEFMKVKSGLSQILNDTIESIVAYSTKSTEKVEGQEKADEAETGAKLEEDLKKAKEIVESLNKLTEREYKQIDEKLVETTISLDYVNREFKNYLALFEAVLKQDDDDRVKKNAEIARLVEQLDKLISQLPKELFSAKGLPHPSDVNEEPATAAANESVVVNSTQASVSTPPATEPKSAKSPSLSKTPQQRKASARASKKKGDSVNRGEGSSKKSSPFKKIIDIKKEIAISILNVGEVLAKTIDYYSMSSSNGNKEEDLKELIKISEQQAAKQAVAKQQTVQTADLKPSVKDILEVPTVIAEDSKENVPSCVDVEPEKLVEEVKPEQAVEVEAKQAEEIEVKVPEVAVNGHTEEVAASSEAPIDGILELNVLTNDVEASSKDQQQSGSNEDVAGKATNGSSQQQSSAASSLSSPTLSTTSSLSASRTGSSSPVPPISSSSSEQQQLSNIDECGSDSAANRRQVTAEATSESTPVITNERVVSESDSDTNECKTNGVLPSEDLLNGECTNDEPKPKMTTGAEIDIEAAIEKPKHVLDDGVNACGGLRKEISFLVKEMTRNDQETQEEKLALVHDHASSSIKMAEVEENALLRSMVKSDESESSSDILSSSNNDDHLDALTKPLDMNDDGDEKLLDCSREQKQQQQEPETTPVVFRNTTATDSSNVSSNGSSTTTFNGVGKRMSLDEELMYQLEEVDKKVKYMNETCSENEGDDDDDDYDQHDTAFSCRRSLDDDEELENMEDDERLFHPRTPAKIKSEVRQQRNTELQEEIKQISSVIQDLVQTINVKNNSSSSTSSSSNNVILLNNATDMGTPDFYKTPNNSITLNTSSATSERKRSTNNNNNNGSKRSSVSSTNSSFSSIPVRQQKVLTKQKATTASIEDEQCHPHQTNETSAVPSNSMIDEETLSFKSVICSPNNSEIFVDLDSSQGSSPQKVNVNKKFKSKLPVKK